MLPRALVSVRIHAAQRKLLSFMLCVTQRAVEAYAAKKAALLALPPQEPEAIADIIVFMAQVLAFKVDLLISRSCTRQLCISLRYVWAKGIMVLWPIYTPVLAHHCDRTTVWWQSSSLLGSTRLPCQAENKKAVLCENSHVTAQPCCGWERVSHPLL
jgi:hypothetical protein